MKEHFEIETLEESRPMNMGTLKVGDVAQEQADIYGFVTADALRMVETYKAWRKNAPDIQSIVSEFCSWVDFSRESLNLIEVATNLATEEMNNPYHNNQHLLEVFTFAFSLGYEAYKQGRICERNFARLLTAALLHDYAHDGTTNDGVQFKLEKISIDSSEPALRGVGATLNDLTIIRAMILGTDVTKDFSKQGARSPADTLKLYKVGKVDHVHEELEILEDMGLVDLALMLNDADIGAGFLDKDLLNENTRKLNDENGTPLGKPSQQFFFMNVCGSDLFYSDSGIELFGQRLSKIKEYVFDYNTTGLLRTPK